MRKFSQLSYHERCKIYMGLSQQKSKLQIAEKLERSLSTITREIMRNSDHYGYLYPQDAHKLAQKRKNVNKPKIDRALNLKNHVVRRLKQSWSPYAIAVEWRAKPNQNICKETIYQWLYSDNNPEKIDLRKHLVRAHKKRGLKPRKNRSTIKNRISIHDRPENINNRSESGHFECDLMFNKGSQSKNICTLIERVSRKAFLMHNQNKSTKTVIGRLIKRIKNDGLTVKSITFDNGTEFASHGQLNELGINTYFCDPGKPWQKGAIENLNGILRRFFPDQLPAADITQEYVAHINKRINQMPREILSNKTPETVFKKTSKFMKLKESRLKLALPATEAVLYNQKTLSVAFHY